jgi:hypothetical protein
MNKKLYIGFSIDMDGPNKLEEFRSGCNNLITFFNELKCLNSCTWLINHNKSYDTLGMHPELIKKIYKLVKDEKCCIGLHTHFNNTNYNPPKDSLCPEIPGVTRGGWTKMQENKDYWYDSGLKIPKEQIEKFIKDNFDETYPIECFKAGNHMRNEAMFESLTELGFKYDCTCGYEIKREYTDPKTDIHYKVYNDINVFFKDGPFHIKTDKGSLLEIPESPTLRPYKKELKNNLDKNIYYLYQIHPDEVSDTWDKNNPKDKRNVILKNLNFLKNNFKNYSINFLNMKEMGIIINNKKDFFFKDVSNVC